MTLTIGTGPFGRGSEGVFNFERSGPAQVLYWHPYPRRVRGEMGGRTVVDSRRGHLLHETGLVPVGYFPLDDFDRAVLEACDKSTHCAFKGDASYLSVRVGERVADAAVWHYPQPVQGCPPIAGYAAVRWDAMDAWFEEDEQVHTHLRDPFHRVDVRQGSRSVRVEVAGEVVAATERPKLVFETGLPMRYYVPADDVRTELLTPSETVTRCPYKGQAAYWSVQGPDGSVADAAFSLPDPLPEAMPAAGHYCFLGEEVAVRIDGES